MKLLVHRLQSHASFVRLVNWGKLIAIAGFSQAVVQVLGFVCGILIIRQLPVQEYAFYTLANTMLGTMTVLADGGIAAGVMTQGGKVWKEREKFGAVLATGLHLRKQFAIGSLLISIPVLVIMLLHHGASWLMTTLLLLSLLPAFFSALSDTLLQIAPKLQQDIVPLQKNQISANIGRLILTGLTVFVFPFAFLVVFASGLPRIWANVQLRKISAPYANWDQAPDPKVQKEIVASVRRILPGSIYYCVSGQITVWLISIFGSTKALAQVGALGRFAMILNFFSALFLALIVPRFARLPDNRKLYLKYFLLIQAGLFLLCFLIVSLVSIFSNDILWLLGSSFTNLTAEVVLIFIGGCMVLISTSTHQLLSARGIIVPPLVFISSAVAVQVLIAFAIPLNQVEGILYYGIYTSAAIYVIRLIYLLFYYTG